MNNFETYIKGSKPVVVDFSAEWCGPCKMMDPVLHQIKEKIGDRAMILKIDIDKSPQIVEQYNIRAVPTLIIFKDGEMLWRNSGVTSAREILKQLNSHIS